MDQQFPIGARRNEDIALDLFKVIASTTHVARPAAGATGFGVTSAPKAEDQVANLLELYQRCLSAVAGK
jgi:hypothetical protein